MKKSLQEKLKKYGTMAAAVTGAVASADAQVVYTDIIPDSTFNNDGDVYNLDLNNDAIIDFQINLNTNNFYTTFGSGFFSNTNNDVMLNPTAGNRFLGSGGGPFALSNGSNISAAGSFGSGSATLATYYWGYSYWLSTSTYTTQTTTTTTGGGTNTVTNTFTFSTPSTWSGTYSGGNFLGQTDKYLGLEFQILGQTHYGWARLTVSGSADSFTIKDYAYDATPATAILAGDMGVITSISELNLIKDVTVFVSNDALNIQVPAEVVGHTLKLVDMLGKVVVNETISFTISFN